MPWGRRHDGAFVRRLHHGGALLLSCDLEERAGRGMGGRGTTKIGRPTGFPANTWPLPSCACGQSVPQLPS